MRFLEKLLGDDDRQHQIKRLFRRASELQLKILNTTRTSVKYKTDSVWNALNFAAYARSIDYTAVVQGDLRHGYVINVHSK